MWSANSYSAAIRKLNAKKVNFKLQSILLYFVFTILFGVFFFLLGFFSFTYTNDQRAELKDLPAFIDSTP